MAKEVKITDKQIKKLMEQGLLPGSSEHIDGLVQKKDTSALAHHYAKSDDTGKQGIIKKATDTHGDVFANKIKIRAKGVLEGLTEEQINETISGVSSGHFSNKYNLDPKHSKDKKPFYPDGEIVEPKHDEKDMASHEPKIKDKAKAINEENGRLKIFFNIKNDFNGEIKLANEFLKYLKSYNIPYKIADDKSMITILHAEDLEDALQAYQKTVANGNNDERIKNKLSHKYNMDAEYSLNETSALPTKAKQADDGGIDELSGGGGISGGDDTGIDENKLALQALRELEGHLNQDDNDFDDEGVPSSDAEIQDLKNNLKLNQKYGIEEPYIVNEEEAILKEYSTRVLEKWEEIYSELKNLYISGAKISNGTLNDISYKYFKTYQEYTDVWKIYNNLMRDLGEKEWYGWKPKEDQSLEETTTAASSGQYSSKYFIAAPGHENKSLNMPGSVIVKPNRNTHTQGINSFTTTKGKLKESALDPDWMDKLKQLSGTDKDDANNHAVNGVKFIQNIITHRDEIHSIFPDANGDISFVFGEYFANILPKYQVIIFKNPENKEFTLTTKQIGNELFSQLLACLQSGGTHLNEEIKEMKNIEQSVKNVIKTIKEGYHSYQVSEDDGMPSVTSSENPSPEFQDNTDFAPEDETTDFDVVAAIVDYNAGTAGDEEILKLFSHLIKNQIYDKLDADITSTAQTLMNDGIIDQEGNINMQKYQELVGSEGHDTEGDGNQTTDNEATPEMAPSPQGTMGDDDLEETTGAASSGQFSGPLMGRKTTPEDMIFQEEEPEVEGDMSTEKLFQIVDNVKADVGEDHKVIQQLEGIIHQYGDFDNPHAPVNPEAVAAFKKVLNTDAGAETAVQNDEQPAHAPLQEEKVSSAFTNLKKIRDANAVITKADMNDIKKRVLKANKSKGVQFVETAPEGEKPASKYIKADNTPQQNAISMIRKGQEDILYDTEPDELFKSNFEKGINPVIKTPAIEDQFGNKYPAQDHANVDQTSTLGSDLLKIIKKKKELSDEPQEMYAKDTQPVKMVKEEEANDGDIIVETETYVITKEEQQRIDENIAYMQKLSGYSPSKNINNKKNKIDNSLFYKKK